jgi:hypothetical protein
MREVPELGSRTTGGTTMLKEEPLENAKDDWVEEIPESELPVSDQELLHQAWMQIEKRCQEDLWTMLEEREQQISD